MAHRWPILYGRTTEKVDIILGGAHNTLEKVTFLALSFQKKT